MKNILNGFKQFILRGNVVDLAVGVVIGAAFGAVVNALVKDLLTPLVSAVAMLPDFSGLTFTIRGSKFLIGDFLNNLLSFLMIAAAIYLFVVTPINKLTAGLKKDAPTEPITRKCPECLSEIPKAAKRCAYCTSQV